MSPRNSCRRAPRGCPERSSRRRRRSTTRSFGSMECRPGRARCRPPASGRSASDCWGRPTARRNDTGDRAAPDQDRAGCATLQLYGNFFCSPPSRAGEGKWPFTLRVVVKCEADLLEVVHAHGTPGRSPRRRDRRGQLLHDIGEFDRRCSNASERHSQDVSIFACDKSDRAISRAYFIGARQRLGRWSRS